MCWLWPEFRGVTEEQWRTLEWIEKFAAAVTQTKKFETWKLSPQDILEEMEKLPIKNYADAAERIYWAFMRKIKPSASRWGDKNNFYTGHVRLLADLFPEAQFLHIVRDPRDVACSYRELASLSSRSPYRPTLPVACNEIASEWMRNVHNAHAVAQSMDPRAYCIVKYENLVVGAEEVTRTVCDCLNVSFEQQMLLFHEINKRDRLEPQITMDWKQRTLEPLSASHVGRYRSELSEEECAVIVAVAGDLMASFGYLD